MSLRTRRVWDNLNVRVVVTGGVVAWEVLVTMEPGRVVKPQTTDGVKPRPGNLLYRSPLVNPLHNRVFAVFHCSVLIISRCMHIYFDSESVLAPTGDPLSACVDGCLQWLPKPDLCHICNATGGWYYGCRNRTVFSQYRQPSRALAMGLQIWRHDVRGPSTNTGIPDAS
jgi:hypothetical protein